MEYLRSCAMFIGRIFNKKPAHREITRCEAYLNIIYKILTWKDPRLSSTTLTALLALLWLVVQFEIKLYSFIFITFLVALLGDYYLEHKSTQLANEDINIEHIQQLVCHFTEVVAYLKTIRKKYPMPFCIIMCMLFLWLTVIARNISGITLTYLGVIGVFIGPVLISRLPSEYVELLKHWLHKLGCTQDILAESELIPYLSNKEKDNDLDSLQTDRTVDSITDSLISGITSMPSHLEVEKDIEEYDDLEPPYRLTRESSTDTDSDRKSMNFESSHFNGDSSSEDENQYRKNLKFSDVNNDLPSRNDQSGILKNLTAMGSNFISKVINSKPKRKDSDSDFEIIDSDEVSNS